MSWVMQRRIVAHEGAVRDLLAALRARLRALGETEETCGTVEIVIAEALNNIVEHAYGGTGGEIALDMARETGGLCCILRDRGRPLPGLRLPEGTAPPAVTPRESLPEGGFGWFLIRALTDRLDYARADGENRLTLHFGPGTGPDLRR